MKTLYGKKQQNKRLNRVNKFKYCETKINEDIFNIDFNCNNFTLFL